VALVQRLLSGRHGTPAAVTLFSRDEFKQFHLRTLLERQYAGSSCQLHFRLGDVRDFVAVQQAMCSAEVVFHAAALKQVPQCEYNPIEAVQTNVMGIVNLVRAAALTAGPVEAVIAASTDKACHPVNVLGMTKALQERILIAASAGAARTRFMCARYGNVLGSRGSVVETFQAQIREGGPVSLTRRDMTRFVVTLDDAVDALIALYVFGDDGEIFIPRVPGMRIATLAECLIGSRKIPLVETGLRPGEKIHEVLINEDEVALTSVRDGYFVLQPMLRKAAKRATPSLSGPFRSNQRLLDHDEVERLLQRHALPPGVSLVPERQHSELAPLADLRLRPSRVPDKHPAGHAASLPSAGR
jgi:UDP-glucose 4-epimerase